MSRRKQAKPRALKHDDDEEDPTTSHQNHPQTTSEPETDTELNEEEDESGDGKQKSRIVQNEENSNDSFYSDVYSSHTSSSFSPSLSDGVATPNSLIHDIENNQLRDDDENEHVVKKLKFSDKGAQEKSDTVDDAVHQSNGDGTYHCQFCDKSFPRLGYLKKHEQSHAEHMPFKCDYCARLFKHKRSRDRHTKLHTGDRRYRCPHCEAAFSRSDHLKIHMKTHDNQKPFQCTVCNRGYNTAAALTSHMQNHKKQAALLGASSMNYSPRSTGSGSSTGSVQKRKCFSAEQNYTEYLNSRKSGNANSLLYCMYCTKSDFQTLDQLHGHIQTMHAAVMREASAAFKTDNLQLNCEFCTMKFPTVQLMFHHIRTTHIDQVNSPNSYIDHMNRISSYGKFPPQFPANEISREKYEDLPSSHTIKSERNSPKSDKDFEKAENENIKQEQEQDSPTDLSKKSNKDDQLKDSRESASISPSAGSFLCNQCNAALSDFESFRIHLKTHLSQGMGSYTCHHCGLSLHDQAEYERHIISHFMLTSSEFSCNFNCNKSFSKADDLQKHLFEMHAQNVYKCGICSDLFDTKVAIQVHFAVAHSNEVKIYRCSACMDVFKAEAEFKHHVKTRHAAVGSVQCLFCRTVCASELEMHFHLATHARQFRCPVCPKSFHVEFLLDRHMQTHHTVKDQNYHYKASSNANISNNNNNVIDYQYRSAYGLTNKFYSPLQVDTNATTKNPNNIYGFYDALGKARYEAGAKNLLEIYNSELASKLYMSDGGGSERPLYSQPVVKPNFYTSTSPRSTSKSLDKIPNFGIQDDDNKSRLSGNGENGFSCGICEKNDFTSEAEVHTHRKVSHNIKTGVSLRCAYCNGNFRSRTELENHMKTNHNTTGKHKCLICDEIFPSPAVLAEHKLSHSQVGPSGKCSRCSTMLPDVTTFKNHMAEHGSMDIPVQCICCRQTLNSEFEVGLHARFHTKSTENEEKTCALCLEILPPNVDSKVCEKCFKKHNFGNKFQNFTLPETQSQEIDFKCNICKVYLISASKLQEHLIEHSFKGCEDHGYSCYICSAVFTAPAGLQMHMMEHGSGSKPYDCNLCKSKFFFRAELENHLINHENGKIKLKEDYSNCIVNNGNGGSGSSGSNGVTIQSKLIPKTEIQDDEEEYIEVEKLVEHPIGENHQNGEEKANV